MYFGKIRLKQNICSHLFNAWSNYYLYVSVTSLRGTGICLMQLQRLKNDFAPLTVYTIIEQFLAYEWHLPLIC